MSNNLNSQISPSLHPQVITSIKGYEEHKVFTGRVDETLKLAYAKVQAVVDTVEELRHDELKTNKAKMVALKEQTDTSLAEILGKLTFHEEMLDDSINLINKQLAAPLKKEEAEGSLSAEIRAHVKSLQPDARKIMMDKATQSGDLTTCAAVLSAPAYLSGIDETQKKVYITQYHRAESPEVVERLNVLGKVKEVIQRTKPIVKREMDSFAAKLANKLNGDESREEFLRNRDRSHPTPTGLY